MTTIFEFAREVIKLKLTDTELSLMCALALIDPSEYISTWHSQYSETSHN